MYFHGSLSFTKKDNRYEEIVSLSWLLFYQNPCTAQQKSGYKHSSCSAKALVQYIKIGIKLLITLKEFASYFLLFPYVDFHGSYEKQTYLLMFSYLKKIL